MNIQCYPAELDYVNAKLREKGQDDKSFLGFFLQACLRADPQNYEIVRPALLNLMQKYPARAQDLAAERSDYGLGEENAPIEG